MKNNCSLCNGKLIDTKDLIIKNGKTYPFSVKQCTKCGHSFSSLYESERLRKEINPSILTRIKRLFSRKFVRLSIFDGRVL